MKLGLFSLTSALAFRSADAIQGIFNCQTQVDACVDVFVQGNCQSGFEACIKRKSSPSSSCVDNGQYSHMNIYVDGKDLSFLPDTQECQQEGQNTNGCNLVTGSIGVKYDPYNSGLICVGVLPATKVVFAIKDESSCDPNTNTVDWVCLSGDNSCQCGGDSACVFDTITPPCSVTPSPSMAPVRIIDDPHIKNWIGEWFSYMGEW